MADIKYWLWYTMAMRNRNRLMMKLFQDMDESIERIYKLTAAELKDIDYLKKEERDLIANKSMKEVERELLFAENYGVRIISIEDHDYPARLKTIYDYPLVLYVRGERFHPEDIFISIVGTRKPGQYAAAATRKIACELAQHGITVVSGMADGIDAYAHKGAMEAGGSTVAVFGCGVNRVYPSFHKDLMLRIMNCGSVISEYPFDTPALGYHFPQRNRIISGMSLGTLIVEAAKGSGSLITARMATDQNRDVFAVPGTINDPRFEGSNELIKTGAKMVTCAKDILDEYEHLFGAVFKMKEYLKETVEFAVENASTGYEEEIMEHLQNCQLHIDELAVKSGIKVKELIGTLTTLELKGAVVRLPGGSYVKK